ncbi:MAG: type I-MYXAN CRISPR-associated protein Cas6/Cmx6 [Calothrix sp. FI2-JRJ7]|jgi:CRISPR-associated protein Cas6|nr:type I-MYXAN CRISPR-associated protein Cas6/Cmx6 [Calothrix sp. FI2-JRJ7]
MSNFIDLAFPVYGTELHADHNHYLLAGISKKFPILHELKELSINTITGIPDKQGKIKLTNKSKLYLRLPVEAIAHVYLLAGESLEIGEYTIGLGNPELQTLKPVETLRARLVTIKGYKEAEQFLLAAERQLKSFDIRANIGIIANDNGTPKRLTLKIKKYTIVGFSVVVSSLKPDDSIKLQVHGLGGKRRLGCGVFFPNITIYQSLKGKINAETTIG